MPRFSKRGRDDASPPRELAAHEERLLRATARLQGDAASQGIAALVEGGGAPLAAEHGEAQGEAQDEAQDDAAQDDNDTEPANLTEDALGEMDAALDPAAAEPVEAAPTAATRLAKRVAKRSFPLPRSYGGGGGGGSGRGKGGKGLYGGLARRHRKVRNPRTSCGSVTIHAARSSPYATPCRCFGTTCTPRRRLARVCVSARAPACTAPLA